MSTKPHQFEMKASELGCTLISYSFGVGILTLPRDLASRLDTPDGWMTVLLAGVVIMALIYLCVALQKNFTRENVFEYLLKGPFSKWIAFLLVPIFIIYFIFTSAVVLRYFGIASKMYLLDQTPTEVLVMAMLVISAYAASKGIEGIIFLNILFVPTIVSALIGVSILNIGNVEVEKVLPVMPEGVFHMFDGIFIPLFALNSVVPLFFLLGFLHKNEVKSTPLMASMGITSLIYSIIVIITYTIFSVETSKIIVFPTIEVAKEIELGGIFERVESIFLAIWVLSIFTSVMLLFFLSVQVTREIFLTNKQTPWLPGVFAFIIFLVTFFPENEAELQSFVEYLNYSGLLLILTVLLVTGFTIMVRKKQKNKSLST
ncbi:GerAB/ArcD/ProY family transporter [Bacillus sp. FJAT-44742]|uniref:GerAB/ArcD/ProY family transporter n=1 Tax=Bacillus sp. FJAT-44742 TaxID=2014005 RepID=UPI000C240918|nr:GerAB/ArcD/ProY family transporter [Bacillus sp. FJAT-44742]